MEIWHGERGFVEEGNIEEYGSFWSGWSTTVSTTVFNGPYRVSLCKYIERDSKNFLCFIKCGVGDRTKLKFWYDKWHGDIPLKEAFLKLFFLTRNREALVADCMQFCNDTVYWALNFIATVLDWELGSLLSFLDMIYPTSVSDSGKDKLYWTPSKQRCLRSNSTTKLLVPKGEVIFPLKSI